ncbi:PfkB family carbohydrate kinase [Scandinavium sp. M-37]|uniref:PfkB family carbohydrate kinase n=1 Tax=Scandinavium sp. M-37 TaxID=3373077 RepID=UPI0037471714
MPYNYKKMRSEFILTEIRRLKKVTVKTLANQLNVTERTIRRDLVELKRTGNINIHYGGASLLNKMGPDLYWNDPLLLHNNMDVKTTTTQTSSALKKGNVFILGSFNTDLVYRLAHFPASGETTRALYSCCLPGGKGCNQAVASVNALAATHFVAKIGEDEYAHKARLFLETIGLASLTLFTHPQCPTGSAVVMVSESEGDNAIVINPGANQTFSSAEITSCHTSIAQSDVFLIQMENNPDASGQALTYAQKCGLTTIFNPAPWRPEVLDLLPFATIVTPNLTEAEAITSMTIHSKQDIRQAAEQIRLLGPHIVIITLGKEGCWMFDGEQHREYPAFPAVNIDTAGAGDAFNGALAARLANSDSLDLAVRYASAFASLAVERSGAANMPEHTKALEKMSEDRSSQ